MIKLLRKQSPKTMCSKCDEDNSLNSANQNGTWSPFTAVGNKVKNDEGEFRIMSGNEVFCFKYEADKRAKLVGRLVAGTPWELPNNKTEFVSLEKSILRQNGKGKLSYEDRRRYEHNWEDICRDLVTLVRHDVRYGTTL